MISTRRTFHKSLNGGEKMLAGLRSMLGVKSNPAKHEMNVLFSFTKEIHAGVEAPRHGFDTISLCMCSLTAYTYI